MSVSAATKKKLWTLADVQRVENGKVMVSILKMSHPHRKQRLTLVSTPRMATEEYYKDWVYQPYAKEHMLYIANDIYIPTYAYVARLLFNRGKYPGYKYFTPMSLPDSVDMNMNRREYFKRERPIKCGVIRMSMTMNMMRDKRHGWLSRRIEGVVGRKYLNHPKQDEESLVMLLPPPYLATAVNTLERLGFVVQERAEAEAGEEAVLKKLALYCDIGQYAALSYIWILLVVFLFSESKRVAEAFQEYKRDMIRKAGRDPSEFGL